MDTIHNIKHMYKIYEMLPTTDTSKQLILEPLTCVLKLSLLQWKPDGTKVSVSKNSLLFHEPTLIQGLTRRLSGDSRQDLHNICDPIVKCVEWYPLEDYKFFYDECIKGLQVLKASYESNSIINHTIDHYIGLLQGATYEPLEDTAVTGGLKNMWSEKEILILRSMLEHILSLPHDDRHQYVTILEQLLSIKEDKVNSYIQSVSTSYS